MHSSEPTPPPPRVPYTPPALEPVPGWIAVTGVSLPISSDALEEFGGGE